MQVYRMAERNIGIESLYERVHVLCADYRVSGTPDFTVKTTREGIERERAQSAREEELEGRPVRAWGDAYLEELAVYRQIAEHMPAYDTFLMHSSAVAVDGLGYLFAAKSGTGKSTHARLWQKLLGDRFTYVNDDKPLIRLTADAALICGTPYDGKHHRSANVAVPLTAVCFLQRGDRNLIREITGAEAFPRLLQQVYRPQDRAAMERTIALLRSLTERVKFYELSCNMDLEAAQVAFEAMAPSEP